MNPEMRSIIVLRFLRLANEKLTRMLSSYGEFGGFRICVNMVETNTEGSPTMKIEILLRVIRATSSSKVIKMVSVGAIATVSLVILSSAFAGFDTDTDSLTAFSVVYPIVSDYFRRKIFLSVVLAALFCNVMPMLDEYWSQILSDIENGIDEE